MHAAVTAGTHARTHAGGRGCVWKHWLTRAKAPPTVRGKSKKGKVLGRWRYCPVQTVQAEVWLWGRGRWLQTSFTVINERYGCGALHDLQHTGHRQIVDWFDWVVLKSGSIFLLYCQIVDDKKMREPRTFNPKPFVCLDLLYITYLESGCTWTLQLLKADAISAWVYYDYIYNWSLSGMRIKQ